MGELIDRLKTEFGDEGKDENDIGCRVVVSDDEAIFVEVCGNTVHGTASINGYEIAYCEEADGHMPSNATPWSGGLIEPLEFYIPEEGEIIEVE